MTPDQVNALFDLGLAGGMSLMFALGYLAGFMP